MATNRHRNLRKPAANANTGILKSEPSKKRMPKRTESLYLEKQNINWTDPVALCTVLGTFAFYMKTLHPSLPGGDSGELVIAAHEFGVAHPPGYPFFTLLSRLAMLVLPVGSPVWRVNVLSATLGALTSGLLYIMVFRLSSSCGAGVLGAGMFSLSRLVWAWSGSAEVFSLNNFLLAALMLAAVRFDEGGAENMIKMSYVGSLLCGLCLSNQHTSVLYIVVLVPWVMLRLWRAQLLSLGLLLKLCVLFALGLSTYLYLPLSSSVNIARWTWGDQSSVSGFLRHLLRQEYGTWDLLKDHSGQGFIAGIQSYMLHLLSDLTIPVTAFAFLSLGSSRYRYKELQSSVLAIFTVMFVGYVAFFCWRANLDISKPLFFKVVERFWLQSDLVLVALASVCFGDVCRFVSKRFELSRYHLDLLLMVPLVGMQLHAGWLVCDNSSNTVVRDFALQSLASFPNNSIILTKGDLPSNSFRYFHLCEGVRPDLTVFDQEVLTYQWSLPMTSKFYPDINFPGDYLYLKAGVEEDGRKAFTFKNLIDANYHRPIFACIGMQEYEPSWQKFYALWPYSICWQVVSQTEKLNPSQWNEMTTRLADQWQYSWDSFEEGSWERVANDEMWRAKTATAVFFLDLALTLPTDSDEYFDLLQHCYKIYTDAMEKASRVSVTNSTEDIPAYWHKNFAIVCERLTHRPTRRADSVPDPLTLVRLTIHHFQLYLRLSPNDQDFDRIQQAVETLQNYLNNVDKATTKS